MIMLALDVTFVNLEDLEIEMLDWTWLTSFLWDWFKFIEKILVLYIWLLRTLGIGLFGSTHMSKRGIHLVIAHGMWPWLLIRHSALLVLIHMGLSCLRWEIHLLKFIHKLIHRRSKLLSHCLTEDRRWSTGTLVLQILTLRGWELFMKRRLLETLSSCGVAGDWGTRCLDESLSTWEEVEIIRVVFYIRGLFSGTWAAWGVNQPLSLLCIHKYRLMA